MADFGLLLCWPFETIISMYKLLLLFHFVQSLTDCAANNSTISRGVVGKEGADWRVKLTPCDCCNANRSVSPTLSFPLSLPVKWLPFLFATISRDPKCPYSAKKWLCSVLLLPGLRQVRRVGSGCGVARSRRNMRTNGREWHGWADTTTRSW